jgi:magnesium-transporting ATPase (P-type)
MLLLLLAGGAIYVLVGDLQEALILLAFASMSVVITVVQEARTERVLEAVRDLTSPRALVIRGGLTCEFPAGRVIRGDIVILVEGDPVPADAMLLQCRDLQADEPLLTGESVPARKAERFGEAGSRKPSRQRSTYCAARRGGGRSLTFERNLDTKEAAIEATSSAEKGYLVNRRPRRQRACHGAKLLAGFGGLMIAIAALRLRPRRGGDNPELRSGSLTQAFLEHVGPGRPMIAVAGASGDMG